MAAFRQGLRELGYVEGKNIVIEERYGEGRLERMPELAEELVGFKADVIVTHGGRWSRASFYLYNTKEEIDKLVEGIHKVIKVFK